MKNLKLCFLLIVLTAATSYAQTSDSCSGVPSQGWRYDSATYNSGSCGMYDVDLEVNVPDAGASLQWQASADGIHYTNIAGAVSYIFSSLVSSDTIFFRDSVFCAYSGLSNVHTAREFTATIYPTVRASLPYFQGFENWSAGCYTYDRPDSSISLSPTYGINSFRREDEGSDAGWLSSDLYPGPDSTLGLHSACIHFSDADEFHGSIGAMYLYIDLSTPGEKNIGFDCDLDGHEQSLRILLSEDGGYTFSDIGIVNTAGGYGWRSHVFTTSSVAPNAIIMLKADSGLLELGDRDLGIDNLSITNSPTIVNNVINKGFDVVVYPNPTKDMLNVKVTGASGSNPKISITSIDGRFISTTGMMSNTATINIQDLAAGVYLLHYQDGVNSKIVKVDKQ